MSEDNNINVHLASKIDTRNVNTLKPFVNNPCTHSKKQIWQIADSISRFGWTNPISIDGEGNVIAGHGRIEAAKLLGKTEVPVSGLHDMAMAIHKPGQHSATVKLENLGSITLVLHYACNGAHGKYHAVLHSNGFCTRLRVIDG